MPTFLENYMQLDRLIKLKMAKVKRNWNNGRNGP